MMDSVVWAQEAVFIHIYLRILMLGQVCSWVELPVQRRLCPIFVREVGSPDLHECLHGLTGSQRTPEIWSVTIKLRVSPDSHLTTHSLCDIYLLVLLVSFWATEIFEVSPRVSYTLRHFSSFHRWIRCLTRFSGFSLEGGIYPLLAMPETFHFPFSFNTV